MGPKNHRKGSEKSRFVRKIDGGQRVECFLLRFSEVVMIEAEI